MIVQPLSQTIIRAATSKDLRRLANLIHFEAYVHRHLDYRPPLDWFGKEPFLVIEKNQSIMAALACPPDPPMAAWIRLFAARSEEQVKTTWPILWDEARKQLLAQESPRWAAAIPMHGWFESSLKDSGFEPNHNIIMLSWHNAELPPAPRVPDVNIRPMSLDDLEAVQKVDASAFPPIWQHSLTYLELAFRQASIASVAEFAGKPVGYQVSTATPVGGHLARLAVDPQRQGLGIGRALLHDLLSQYLRRGARTVTVNTQKNNTASLALYQSMGFDVTAEEYPVYQIELA